MEQKSRLKHSLGVRLALIAVLTIVLLIPAIMIQIMISERESRRNSASWEVSGKWGMEQTVTGPILTLPYQVHSRVKENYTEKIITTTEYAHFLPDDLSINGKVETQVRYRGIYEVILYNTNLNLESRFTFPDYDALNMPQVDILWEEAYVSIGISDMKGIKDIVTLEWDGKKIEAEPGLKSKELFAAGISAEVPLGEISPKEFKFSTSLNLNGSTSLKIVPIGKETRMNLSSDWQNPSFSGNYLPETRDISEAGFSADWRVLHLNRNYPQQWKGPEHRLMNSAFGVDLLLGVDEYQKTMRTAKYAIMFISLTFLTFFMIELLNKKTIHPIQYLLIGFALLVFYTLLLSFSEHIVFQYAYLIASGAIITLIALYSRSVLADTRQTAIITGVLVLLYGYLYVVLQLQDYALLMGSLGLFAVLALVMYLTRNIDWFTIMKTAPPEDIQEGI